MRLARRLGPFLLFVVGCAAQTADAGSEPAGATEHVGATSQRFECHTATDVRGARWRYAVHGLDAFDERITLRVSKSAGACDGSCPLDHACVDGACTEAFPPVELSSEEPSAWRTTDGRLTLRLEDAGAGRRSIRVHHRGIGHARPENGYCSVTEAASGEQTVEGCATEECGDALRTLASDVVLETGGFGTRGSHDGLARIGLATVRYASHGGAGGRYWGATGERDVDFLGPPVEGAGTDELYRALERSWERAHGDTDGSGAWRFLGCEGSSFERFLHRGVDDTDPASCPIRFGEDLDRRRGGHAARAIPTVTLKFLLVRAGPTVRQIVYVARPGSTWAAVFESTEVFGDRAMLLMRPTSYLFRQAPVLSTTLPVSTRSFDATPFDRAFAEQARQALRLPDAPREPADLSWAWQEHRVHNFQQGAWSAVAVVSLAATGVGWFTLGAAAGVAGSTLSPGMYALLTGALTVATVAGTAADILTILDAERTIRSMEDQRARTRWMIALRVVEWASLLGFAEVMKNPARARHMVRNAWRALSELVLLKRLRHGRRALSSADELAVLGTQARVLASRADDTARSGRHVLATADDLQVHASRAADGFDDLASNCRARMDRQVAAFDDLRAARTVDDKKRAVESMLWDSNPASRLGLNADGNCGFDSYVEMTLLATGGWLCSRPYTPGSEDGWFTNVRDRITDTFGTQRIEPSWYARATHGFDGLDDVDTGLLRRSEVTDLARRFPEGRLGMLHVFLAEEGGHYTVLTRIGDEILVVKNTVTGRERTLLSLADFEAYFEDAFGPVSGYALVETDTRIPFPEP